MTRSDLIRCVRERFPHLTTADTDVAVSLILEAIGSTLAAGGRCEFRGFGTFSLNYRRARMGRNPMTGAKVAVPAKSAPHFRPSKALASAVDKDLY